MSHDTPDLALSFGAVADAYDRGRPTYPREAAAWLTADAPVSVLELGAGTGKLTEQLVALGHDVHATDPDAAMLARLSERLPEVRTSQSAAEEIPAGDRSYDVVVCAQAFHWFDLDKALPEIARVLKPGGRLSLVWNQRDERVPWVRRLGSLIGTQEQLREPAAALDGSHLFGDVEEAEFRFRQQIDQHSIKDLVLSRSNVATLPPDRREAKLAEVVAFYGEYGRGMDGMQLPYAARCFRTAVLDRPASYSGTTETSSVPEETQPMQTSDGSETDMLLIDFR
ncbi:class I SAM-dependent methyltransferase [Nocardioides sp.]|uniref:class I SAM-dependent methyltransferase n=1 Tax=Nocardioides sp. TaxID=35761 RepID=UPI001A2EF259|nr:class I SAM-dependent methyltransferase [Nocardioides sp.]MBJ7357548.1 class I SAM-dependent methyltransferase [Nocardioides sp.]